MTVPDEADAPLVMSTIDPGWYRQVLGRHPTGVCVVTAKKHADETVAMVVGSFNSVSLDPPLVAFFPARKSGSWAKLRDCPRFCVNILSAEQENVCRKLASKGSDKFAGVTHSLSTHGSPILDSAVAWIDCDRYSVTDAGDHEMVIGRVLDLGIGDGGLPLLFFRGGYGRFAPATMVADQDRGITLAQLRNVDCARAEMELLATRVGGLCIATVRVGEGLVIAASAGQPSRGGTATLVGQHLPFVPPTGAVFGAWLPDAERTRWATQGRAPKGDRPQTASLNEIRNRGFSVVSEMTPSANSPSAFRPRRKGASTDRTSKIYQRRSRLIRLICRPTPETTYV